MNRQIKEQQMPNTIRFVLVCLAFGCAGVALFSAPTQAEAQVVKYRLQNQVPQGEKPIVYVKVLESLKKLNVSFKRSDGRAHKVSHKNVNGGQEVEVVLPQTSGSFNYKAQITFTTAVGVDGGAEFEFNAVVAAPLAIQLRREKSSLNDKTVVLFANVPVARGELEVVANDGSIAATNEVNLSGIAAGGDLKLTWTGADVEVSKINIKIHDNVGFWQTFELRAFSVHIPHEEVNFDSGKASFAASEEPKLSTTYNLLKKELDKHGENLEISLYIAGYTDTVGSPDGNLALSTGRARAIATYFRKRGIRVPIHYQGFGESALLVKTADNVDEVRNRRALYILSNQKPAISDQIPRSNWKRLQ